MDNLAIKNKVKEILQQPYARKLIPDESGGYSASIQEFPGCFADGQTPQEAIDNLEKVAASWVEVALLNGYQIKDPTEYYGYSGKIALRVPRGLHKQLAELAELEDTSINQLIVSAASEYVGAKKTFEKIMSHMRSLTIPSSETKVAVFVVRGAIQGETYPPHSSHIDHLAGSFSQHQQLKIARNV